VNSSTAVSQIASSGAKISACLIEPSIDSPGCRKNDFGPFTSDFVPSCGFPSLSTGSLIMQ